MTSDFTGSPPDEFALNNGNPQTTQNRKRNLVNQRNFRFRRKQYIEELEARVQDFERQGIAATQQVQEAGRRHAAENAVLRRQLEEQLGWSPEQISALLNESLGPPPDAMSVASTDRRIPIENHGHATRLPIDEVRQPINGQNNHVPPSSSFATHNQQHHYQARHIDSTPMQPVDAFSNRSAGIITHTDDWMMPDRPAIKQPSPPTTYPPPEYHNNDGTNATNHNHQQQLSREFLPSLVHGRHLPPPLTKSSAYPPPPLTDINHNPVNIKSEPLSRTTNPAVMSCESAASILAELKGQASNGGGTANGGDVTSNRAAIRAELGCREGERECEVPHRLVYERMDRTF